MVRSKGWAENVLKSSQYPKKNPSEMLENYCSGPLSKITRKFVSLGAKYGEIRALAWFTINSAYQKDYAELND